MEKKINELKQKGLINIVCYFIEFFLLSSIFKSSINKGKIFQWITTNLSFFNQEILLLIIPSIMLLSTSIRFIYAKYINKQIDIIESVKNTNEMKGSINSDDKLKTNNNLKNNTITKVKDDIIKNNQAFDEINGFNDLENDKPKIMIKTYKN